MVSNMEKRIKELERELIWNYCKEYERKMIFWNIIGSCSIGIPILILVGLHSKSTALVFYLAVVLVLVLQKYIMHECMCVYNTKKYNLSWFLDFCTYCKSIRIKWLYEGKISKIDYELYTIFEKREECNIEMSNLLKREKYLKKISNMEPEYSVEKALEIAKLPEPEKTRELNKLILEEFRVESC